MRKTKIVCTIGPSVGSEDKIRELIRSGMNVARLNLSHGKREEHLRMVKLVRGVAADMRRTVGILFDSRGPEVRTGTIKEGGVNLEDGQDFILTTEKVTGDEKRVSVTYSRLHEDIGPGCTVLIDDGLIILKVMSINGPDIHCRVVHGGELRSYKGLNTPGTRINLPAVGKEDRLDIEAALANNVHFLAASFTRNAQDIIEIRRLAEESGGNIMIIAKIESREGVENFDTILDVADGIMVARGDLGVEIPPEEVPLLQKQFIRKCNLAGKPVITATQMLDSMIRNPRPTRAEANDVANAIFDGTDAVMLSGETAVGRFPIEAVETMARIALKTEEGIDYRLIRLKPEQIKKSSVPDAISYATAQIAEELNCDAIITSTQSGQTARMVSKYKPKAPIIAVSSQENVAAQLTLTWGVKAVICPPAASTDEMFVNAIQASLKKELIDDGSLVVITAGVPVGVSGTTNLIRVETVGDILVKGTGIGKGSATGRAYILKTGRLLSEMENGAILVAPYISGDEIEAVNKASALITEEGGLTSPGAIVAINKGIPAIVGVERAAAIIGDGEMITVDAARGLIYRGKANVL